MAVNNIYYVDMEKRYLDYQNGTVDMRNLHPMVYDDRNVALAVRQLGKSPGRMTPGPDGSNYKTLENYSVMELVEIVKERLFKKRVEDPKGSPQGSILGPLISNVYLHRFDVWLRDQGDCWHDPGVAKFHSKGHIRRNLEATNLKIGIHVRYADDILVLCKDHEDAQRFRHSVTNYLTRNMRLVINEDKTKIYDLTKEKMKYLGYDFYVFKQNTKNVKKKGKLMVANRLPQKKADEIVGKCRELLRAIRKEPNFETFNNWNIYVVGIHNYYRGMTHFCESFSEIGWRIKKLFYHTMENRATFTKEQSCKNQFLGGKYCSWGKDGYYCFGGIPIIRIEWANWDSGLISATKGVVRRENPYDYGEKKHKNRTKSQQPARRRNRAGGIDGRPAQTIPVQSRHYGGFSPSIAFKAVSHRFDVSPIPNTYQTIKARQQPLKRRINNNYYTCHTTKNTS